MHKKRILTYVYFSVAFTCLLTRPVLAYIDPSVMSYAIQAVAGIAIALGTVVGLYWRRFTKGIRKLFRVKSNHYKEVESQDIEFINPDTGKKITPADISKREIAECKDWFLIVNRDNSDKKTENTHKGSVLRKTIHVGKELLPGVLIVFAITYMLCYYAPLEMYMNNKLEFWFDYSVLQPELVAMAVSFLKIGLLFVVACYVIHKKLYKIVLGGGVSSLVILYVQGNYLASKLPGMDGSEIDWTQYFPQMEESIILCLIVIIGFAVLYRALKYVKFTYIVDFTCVLITAMLVVSLSDITNKQNGKETKSGEYSVTKLNEFEYSSDKNFIIFVVDAFDSETFANIVTENPDYQYIFSDFNYYPDTVGAYPYTSRAIPFMFSGIWYENDGDYREFESNAVAQSPLLSRLQNEGYRLDVYEDEFLWDTDYSRYSNLIEATSVLKNKYDFRMKELNLTLYKYAPYFLKSHFTVNLDEFKDTRELENVNADLFHMSDSDFYNDLNNVEITAVDNKVFKFIHIEGAHIPFNYDENMNPIEWGTYEQKAKATLTILNTYLQKLKDAGVYDNSTIMIMGDHGYDPDTDDEYATIECRNNPLLMVKGEYEQYDSMQWNGSPVSYDDLQGAYQNLLNGNSGISAFDGLTDDNAARRFLLYRWSNENIMTEYYQTGYATDMETMIPSGNVYEYTGEDLSENIEG